MENIPELEIVAWLCLYPLMFMSGLGVLILAIKTIFPGYYPWGWYLFGALLSLGYFGFSWWSLQGDNMTFGKLMVLIVVGFFGALAGMAAFSDDN